MQPIAGFQEQYLVQDGMYVVDSGEVIEKENTALRMVSRLKSWRAYGILWFVTALLIRRGEGRIVQIGHKFSGVPSFGRCGCLATRIFHL